MNYLEYIPEPLPADSEEPVLWCENDSGQSFVLLESYTMTLKAENDE